MCINQTSCHIILISVLFQVVVWWNLTSWPFIHSYITEWWSYSAESSADLLHIYVSQKGRDCLRLTTPAVSHVTPFLDVNSSKAAQFSLYSVSRLIKDLELQTVLGFGEKRVCVVCVESRLSLSVCYRVVALPLSRRLGVRDRVRVRVTPVPKLEAFYQQKKQQPSQVSESHERWPSWRVI